MGGDDRGNQERKRGPDSLEYRKWFHFVCFCVVHMFMMLLMMMGGVAEGDE